MAFGATGSRPSPELISDQIRATGSASVQIRTSSTVPLSVSLQAPRYAPMAPSPTGESYLILPLKGVPVPTSTPSTYRCTCMPA